MKIMDYKEILYEYLEELWDETPIDDEETIRDWMFGAISYAYNAEIISFAEREKLFRKYEI